MKMNKQCLFLIILLFLTTSVRAEGNYAKGHLTASDIERVKKVKELLYGIDTKSLRETITELEKTHHPQMDLQVKEAMAKAYTDIVRENNVSGQKKKEWLYSMVCLNMAYLQFGGGKDNSGASSLNRLIRQKLKEYLSPGVLKQLGSMYSLE